MINTTMTKQNVNFSINSFEGDFIGFQAYMEGLSVSEKITARSFPVVLTCSCRVLTEAPISSLLGEPAAVPGSLSRSWLTKLPQRYGGLLS